MRTVFLLVSTLLAAVSALAQQQHGQAINTYHRVIAVVPLTGAGTWADPKRPMFAPLPSQMGRGKSGILAYYHEPTDDGKLEIVIFVAVDRLSLQPILAAAAAPGVTIFEPNKQSQQQMSASLKALKKDFDLQRFALRVP